MSDAEKITLAKVIQKIRFISDQEFDGRVYENILLIYNLLNNRERTVLLRGLINMCFIVEDQVLLTEGTKTEAIRQVVEREVKKSNVAIESEIADLNTINELELIRLKSWFVKVIVVSLIVFGTGFIAFMVFTGNSASAIGSALGNVYKVIQTMFGG